jgi:hypothetical protein
MGEESRFTEKEIRGNIDLFLVRLQEFEVNSVYSWGQIEPVFNLPAALLKSLLKEFSVWEQVAPGKYKLVRKQNIPIPDKMPEYLQTLKEERAKVMGAMGVHRGEWVTYNVIGDYLGYKDENKNIRDEKRRGVSRVLFILAARGELQRRRSATMKIYEYMLE